MPGPDAHENIALLPQASTLAERVDGLFLFLVGLDALMVVVLFGLIIGFAAYYRRGARRERTSHLPQTTLEITWSTALLLVFLGIFAWSARLYVEELSPPKDALEIQGIGKQWMWKFEHRGGQREINELHLPLGVPVKLILASQDVIHSFFVPAFRVKQDVVPGRLQATWFVPSRLGRYHLFCAEYCGLDHSRMGGQVVVMEPRDYEAWLAGFGSADAPAAQGEKLFAQFGCSGCHGAGSRVLAPSLAGIFGKTVPLADGSTVTVDENYLRTSILFPDQQVVAGYQPIMPSFAGRLDEAELLKLIAYLRSLSRPDRAGSGPALPPPGPRVSP
ncbi:cytochrome c oxidase subunit II [Candidatus Methylocalor cossyra]|uniref:cytochrome-c oxidase n=1 Tax=Candidatus Methylocalor cossyra TaxID=3108543 RepID=A0ABM9NFN7_9GAMM